MPSLSGRFGNQADHYLGAIAFAKGLDRTLILPPWVEYKQGEPRSAQVPFASYFNVSVLAEYHRVIPMEEFMETLAGEVWPQEERVSFCYGYRKGPEPESCNAKDGNPFGPFWDTFGIDFDRSVAYGPLHYDVHNTEVAADWSRRYPPSEYPVLAFTGAPASYPVQAENVKLSKFLVYNDEMVGRGDAFIRENLARGPFIGIHLRNGPDWVGACGSIGLTASDQRNKVLTYASRSALASMSPTLPRSSPPRSASGTAGSAATSRARCASPPRRSS